MSNPKVIVFTQQDCAPCGWVKNFLAQRGVEFEERSIDSSLAVARELTQRYNSQSTPTVVIRDEVVIGYNPERLDQLLAQ
ncbi:MAG TPA: glutaredoxin family protein [Candidatus Eisenbacteria bacterium]|nr:glutaredoxin family protein [Candidatus Eisenbacteria bacterium]